MDVKIDPSDYPIGGIIVRFQEDDLHEGHHYLLKQVINNHRKVVVFLGVPPIIGTQRNPLDFNNRRLMINTHYPNAVVVSLPDQGDNYRWAQTLDRRIREVFPYGNVLLYGSRDSFIPYYKEGKGSFDCHELVEFKSVSGTEIRKRISETIINSPDFRAGIIYHTYNQPPKIFSASYGAIFNATNQVLLVKKRWEDGFGFPGGFANTDDSSFESTLIRKINHTIKDISYDNIKYHSSMNLEDWRVKSCPDIIMGMLYTANYKSGNLIPKDGIECLEWFSPKETDLNIIVPAHQQFFKNLI